MSLDRTTRFHKTKGQSVGFRREDADGGSAAGAEMGGPSSGAAVGGWGFREKLEDDIYARSMAWISRLRLGMTPLWSGQVLRCASLALWPGTLLGGEIVAGWRKDAGAKVPLQFGLVIPVLKPGASTSRLR